MNSPETGASLQLVVSLANSGDLVAAQNVAKAIQDKDIAAQAWAHLSRANANTQRLEAARYAIEMALKNLPGAPDLRFQRAQILDAQGFTAQAVAEMEILAGGPHASPQLLVHLGRALEVTGRPDQAEARIEAALNRWPADAALHALLAELRWSRGAGPALTARLEQAIDAYPGDLKLRLVAADALRNAGFPGKALELLEEGLRRAPESSAFLTSIGVLLDSLGQPRQALPYLQRAVTRTPDSVPARRNLVPTLLRLEEPREALQVCDALLARLPDDQQLLAWRATSLRALGDAEYACLHDYGRLVRPYQLHSTRAGGIAEFNASLAAELTALHLRQHRPLMQSLRGGSQTERNLPPHNPVIAEFFAMLDEPIRDYIARLGDLDAGHPTARRARSDGAYRISGSWSVQLQPGGFHVNHVHPAGWLSSAYYVELPQVMATDSPRAGWLSFGEPGMALAGIGPDHFVKPEPGLLVLFPSYLWHGTVPFAEGGRRLTAAFDVLPG
jgi:tetratricopeptide (TPR) repeat protein